MLSLLERLKQQSPINIADETANINVIGSSSKIGNIPLGIA